MAVDLTKEIWDCPGEAHDLDMRFNPSSQGPYSEGYHHCDVCDGEFLVSYRVYLEEIAYRKWAKEAARKRKIRLAEEKEQRKTIDAIMSTPRLNIPGANL